MKTDRLFTPAEEDRRELLKIALFSAQELNAALTELGCFVDDWLDTIRGLLAEELGLDPDNLGIDSQIKHRNQDKEEKVRYVGNRLETPDRP